MDFFEDLFELGRRRHGRKHGHGHYDDHGHGYDDHGHGHGYDDGHGAHGYGPGYGPAGPAGAPGRPVPPQAAGPVDPAGYGAAGGPARPAAQDGRPAGRDYYDDGYAQAGLGALFGYGHGHGHGHNNLALLRPVLEKLLANKALLAVLAGAVLLLLALAIWVASLLLGQLSRVGVKGLANQAQPALLRLWEGEQGSQEGRQLEQQGKQGQNSQLPQLDQVMQFKQLEQFSQTGVKGLVDQAQPALKRLWEGQQGQKPPQAKSQPEGRPGQTTK